MLLRPLVGVRLFTVSLLLRFDSFLARMVWRLLGVLVRDEGEAELGLDSEVLFSIIADVLCRSSFFLIKQSQWNTYLSISVYGIYIYLIKLRYYKLTLR